jgi:hypothetical protein
MFDAREERLSQMILSIIRQEQFKGVKSKLEEFESKSTGQLQSDVRVTRAALHDKDVLQEMRAVLDNPGAAQVERVEALVGLSAAMEAEDLQRLRERLKKGATEEVHAVAHGLSLTRSDPPVELVSLLLQGQVIKQSVALGDLPTRLGNKLLPTISEELKAAREDNRVMLLLGCIGLIGTEEARVEILKHQDRFATLVEQQVRLMDLDTLREGSTR